MQQNLVLVNLETLEEMIHKGVKKALMEVNPSPSPLTTLPPEKDKLMTINEVATFFHRSRQTIHAWKRQGILPFHRISRKIYFKLSEVEDSLRKIEIQKK